VRCRPRSNKAGSPLGSNSEVSLPARLVRSALRSRHSQVTRFRSGSCPIRYFALQNETHYSIVRSAMASRLLSASNRQVIVSFGDQHYIGGHRSSISTETTSTRPFWRCYFLSVTTGCAPGNPSTRPTEQDFIRPGARAERQCTKGY
jgi:hypothetical protein